jgi:ubiquitin-like domain-containing CTD phosphatase 1
MRPYLHEFLTSAYEDYDIVTWSTTNMKWIEAKMKELGVSTNANYKITFMLDSAVMVTVHTPRRGLIDMKPLGVVGKSFLNSTAKTKKQKTKTTTKTKQNKKQKRKPIKDHYV